MAIVWSEDSAFQVTARTCQSLLLFTGSLVAVCLLLQRFGIPAGEKAINLVGPIGLLLALVQILRGHLVFSRVRLSCFITTLAFATAGLAYNFIVPTPFGVEPSLSSTAQFFLMTSFSTLSFAEPVPEQAFFRTINFWLAIVAGAGILQFTAQFVNVNLFSFRDIIPNRLLFEDGYNLVIPFGIGSLNKSNGFFLLEPSIFSQFMAIGIIIEVLTLKRSLYLIIFAIAMLLSGAGTGWIVISAFIVSVTLSLGRRGILLAVLTVAIVSLLFVAVVLLAPDIGGALIARMDEISQPGTSGHLRFITPFWVISDVLQQAPATVLAGLGGGVSERLSMPYQYNVNTPVKISLEYGFPALLSYLGTVVLGRKSTAQRALCIPALVLLMFTGGYQQFPPVLYFVLLIISVARLKTPPAA